MGMRLAGTRWLSVALCCSATWLHTRATLTLDVFSNTALAGLPVTSMALPGLVWNNTSGPHPTSAAISGTVLKNASMQGM